MRQLLFLCCFRNLLLVEQRSDYYSVLLEAYGRIISNERRMIELANINFEGEFNLFVFMSHVDWIGFASLCGSIETVGT
ncbi:hypothetical protein WQ54_20100 [Bacillus sp. SA1-12]|uniref:hypothetical protein n=1 Tax=Bacillus sp. SA1-12 TaxID=1455638 RepID=UPI0006270FB5|nr:hypothetical protein [Bacillus sp. SA1-12]KKI90281.1 hypothetical protein WQ54_20100 [Bacillus sp. SA1-12]